jgi:zona occludens toxin
MAVTAYTGLPGSGKSYSVVEYVILPALKKSRQVFTNIPLNMDLIGSEHPDQVTLFEVKDIEENPDWFQEVFKPGATLVLDEAWRVWPAGLKANNLHQGHKSFLAEHRHMVGADGNSTEIVIVTQDLGQVSAYPRSLVETTYRTVKLVAVGANDRFRVDVYQGAATGPNPSEKARVRQIHGGKYKQEIYRYYTSQTMSEAETHGDESRTDTRTNILNTPYFKYGLPGFAVVMLAFIFYGFNEVKGFYGHGGGDADDAPASESVPAASGLRDPQQIVTEVVQQHVHFYQGMKAYIAWNMGHSPWVQYKLGFYNDDKLVVLDETQLGKMGYSIIGYDQCYVQLKGYGDSLNVFCEEYIPEENPDVHRPILDI